MRAFRVAFSGVASAMAEEAVWRWPLLVLWILCGLFELSTQVEVTILDTKAEDSLDWVTYSHDMENTGRRGWREASYNSAGEALRVYTVCRVEAQQVNNWLRTPYIARGTANRLYVEVTFTMRKCTKYHDPERLQQCKESFKLLYYEAESDFANSMRPTWDQTIYTHVDAIAADQVFTDLANPVLNTEVRDLPITRRGLYLAFFDQGACTTLIRVRVYYHMCPSVTKNFAVFPNRTTGQETTALEKVEGQCVEHAAMDKAPTYLCNSAGAWMYAQGGCKCMPGYQPLHDTQCVACPKSTYKWRTGSEACRTCPAFSEAPVEGAVECECISGYYRSASDDKGMPCSTPPSAVSNLSVVFIDQSLVNLSWTQPDQLGGRSDLYYRVECSGCGANVKFQPKKPGFNSTRISISGLNPDTKYKLYVYAENGVSQQSGSTVNSFVEITTEAAIPAVVTEVRVVSVGVDYITLGWAPPLKEPGVVIELYEVRYSVSELNENSSAVDVGNRLNLTLSGLTPQTQYHFQVRAKTIRGWGEYSATISATTGHSERHHGGLNKVGKSSDSPVGIIAGSAVAVVVCMVIVIIMVVIFLNRKGEFLYGVRPGMAYMSNHRSCNEKNVSDCDTLQYSNMQCPHVLDGALVMNGGIPLFTPIGGVKTYIDPHTYEDPNQAVREFTKEIDASCIRIESVIGGGEFGDVCKGSLRVPGKGELTVAIKTLKAGASDKNRLDFLTEASIMGQFDDPNVIYLEGVVTKNNPIMIIIEYMENGSLDSFLRTNDGKFTIIQLVGMLRGIASGMRYLSEMGYVHRDLAARNILVNESFVCKVADFGLSREMECDDTDGAYTTKGGKIPVRWTAPEAIAYRKFTSASDVWSYSVVMWEVIAYAERPYWNWSNQDVIKAVDRGFRLPPPMDCPESIYQLMLDCWQKERSHRPKFNAIVKTLDKLIRAPELLRKIAKPKPHQLLDPNLPDLTNYSSLEEWLQSIKMDRYTEVFVIAGYQNMEQVAQLTLADLLEMGITLVGHQKKIMNSVQILRAQLYGAQVSHGFMV